jgi:hypothetical protein
MLKQVALFLRVLFTATLTAAAISMLVEAMGLNMMSLAE